MLNTAKRSRTTVEALELKGYRHSLTNPAVRKIRLSSLKFTASDAYFTLASAFFVAGSIIASAYIK